MKADRMLFGNMVLIAQSRKLKMRDIMSHPLGPYPGHYQMGMVQWRKQTRLYCQEQSVAGRISPSSGYYSNKCHGCHAYIAQ